MKPSQLLHQYRNEISRIITSHRANNPRVFGLVVHNLDDENSDLDILIDPQKGMTLFDLGAIRSELIDLMGIKVEFIRLKVCLIVSERMFCVWHCPYKNN